MTYLHDDKKCRQTSGDADGPISLSRQVVEMVTPRTYPVVVPDDLSPDDGTRHYSVTRAEVLQRAPINPEFGRLKTTWTRSLFPPRGPASRRGKRQATTTHRGSSPFMTAKAISVNDTPTNCRGRVLTGLLASFVFVPIALPLILVPLLNDHRTASDEDFFSQKYGVSVEYMKDLDGEFDLWLVDGVERRCDATGEGDAGILDCVETSETEEAQP